MRKRLKNRSRKKKNMKEQNAKKVEVEVVLLFAVKENEGKRETRRVAHFTIMLLLAPSTPSKRLHFQFNHFCKFIFLFAIPQLLHSMI